MNDSTSFDLPASPDEAPRTDDDHSLHSAGTANTAMRYLPIVALTTGTVYGYKVVHESAGKYVSVKPQIGSDADLYPASFPFGQWITVPAKLILCVSTDAIELTTFSVPRLNAQLHARGMSPAQVILMVEERANSDDYEEVLQKLQQVRQSGYRLALDGAQSSYPWPHSVTLLRPDYVTVNARFIRHVGSDKIKAAVLETMVELSRKLQYSLIAEGIDTDQDLKALLRLGVHFGSGHLLGRAETAPMPCAPAASVLIQAFNRQSTSVIGRTWTVEDIVTPVKAVDERTQVADVVQYFKESEHEIGIAVVRDKHPIGLVMREKLFRRLAFKYGYSLYWNREISNLMDGDPLMLETDTPLEVASRLSMSRNREQVYDLVIATNAGQLAGIVTIQDILNVITSAQIELARDENPLTGLPGNRGIEHEMEHRLHTGRSLSIIYADLDHFKWFNDMFGFRRGDLVINFTANLLKDAIARHGELDDFIGHIGGDDFILITEAQDPDALCQAILSRFDKEISQFYPEDAGRSGPLDMTDRAGHPIESNGIGISLSVLECSMEEHSSVSLEVIAEKAGQIKRLAKGTVGSVMVKGTLLT